ncbi:MAG: LLM class F420-dependent oxidoreductase [Acidimicrobiales bacterium]
MRLSMPLSYAGGFTEAADMVVEMEKVGLEVVWVAEAYGFDAPSHMGYLAARTTTVQIGAAILPIYSRTPTLLAQTAAGVDYVSGGRAILGLGASGPQVIEGWHGVAYDKPLARTAEIIDVCRQVWRRQVVTHEGIYHIPLPEGQGTGLGKALKMITHPVRDAIPIYVASLGPANVAMTAELADGWLPILFIPEKAASVWAEPLEKGRAKRDDGLAPLEVVAGGMLAVGEDVDHLVDAMRPMVALYVGGMGARGKNFYNDLACRYGYEAEASKVQDLYLSGSKREAAAALPDDMVRSMALVGTEGFVRDRIAAYREAGVTMLNITPVGPDPVKLVEKVRGWLD